jgi:hypothetical protein
MNLIVLYSFLGVGLFVTIILFAFYFESTGSFLGVKTTEQSAGDWLATPNQAKPNNTPISSLTIINKDDGNLVTKPF